MKNAANKELPLTRRKFSKVAHTKTVGTPIPHLPNADMWKKSLKQLGQA